jgi:hypothetical protein
MAIRSLDRPQKEKRRSGSTGIPEKKSIPSTKPVSKFHEDDEIEGNTIEIQTMESSDIESTSKSVEDMHIKNQDLGDSARKMQAKEAPISEKAAGSRALNASSISQQMQANPHSSHQGRESPYTNASKLDSIEVPIGESKQGTNNDNMETSRIRIQQEQGYKMKEDEDQLDDEGHFNSQPPLMYSVPWFHPVDAWTKQYVEFTDSALMIIDYWLDLISTTWLGKDKGQIKGVIE